LEALGLEEMEVLVSRVLQVVQEWSQCALGLQGVSLMKELFLVHLLLQASIWAYRQRTNPPIVVDQQILS